MTHSGSQHSVMIAAQKLTNMSRQKFIDRWPGPPRGEFLKIVIRLSQFEFEFDDVDG